MSREIGRVDCETVWRRHLALVADASHSLSSHRFGGRVKLEVDKTTVLYNANITITGIPLEASD